MHEYYFKIKKGDIEFECSTTDKLTFEQQLSDWINGIVQSSYIKAPKDIEITTNNQIQELESKAETKDIELYQPQRSGFINVKNLTSINSLGLPTFDTNFSNSENSNLVDEENSFEKALAESIEHPKTEVIEKTDFISDFDSHLREYNPQNDIDNLIVTALYISNIERKERFTIKMLNAKLVPATSSAINHATIEEAIKQDLIKIIPDLTGTSDFTEYSLTENGENYFI